MSYSQFQLIIIAVLLVYQAIASTLENRQPYPGKRYDIGGYKLHLHCQGTGTPTIVIDSSLGGLEGYLLMDQLSKFATVYIYDRAGYGWSDHSPHPRTSRQVVKELHCLFQQANISSPCILVGDSFGSYNMRLYAHEYPEQVCGLVLTDGLHESGMLNMPLSLKLLKLFFISGFLMSTIGGCLGIIRLLANLGVFEWLKPELKQFDKNAIAPIKRSFSRPKHWITMSREMIDLERSGRQLKATEALGTLPIISIKSASFFKPNRLTKILPLKTADQLREDMHPRLLALSTHSQQYQASQSSHFVWSDQPEIIVKAVKALIEQRDKTEADHA